MVAQATCMEKYMYACISYSHEHGKKQYMINALIISFSPFIISTVKFGPDGG